MKTISTKEERLEKERRERETGITDEEYDLQTNEMIFLLSLNSRHNNKLLKREDIFRDYYNLIPSYKVESYQKQNGY